MKPTRARNSLAPLLGDVMNGMVVEHVVSRTLRDSAALLDLTAGPVVGDPYMAPPREHSYLEEVSREPGRLRVATWSKSIRNTEIDPECRAAVDNTAALLVELGHEVEEAFPPINSDLLASSILTIWAAGAAATIDLFRLSAGRAPSPEFFEPITWALYERGQSISASEYLRAVALTQLIARQIGGFFESYDVWLSPTLEKPPLPIGAIDRHESDLEKAFAPIMEYSTFTPIFNATGQPAISLPLHWTASGLPVGVQFAGRFGDEATLFRLAAQLETARPWSRRKPSLAEHKTE
jgi:amidase